MAVTAFGAALRMLREKTEMSQRAASGVADLDHAYWNRLEAGEKDSPSSETVAKISKALGLSERNRSILEWLSTQQDVNLDLIDHIEDPTVSLEVFTMAAGIRFRGTVRPDAATLINRAKKVLEED